ncbi:MAG: translation initiation factor IF-3 [Chloroflexia bacterium]|nr:translation initiation factor IF-3 [Chloroflexia bacterium]
MARDRGLDLVEVAPNAMPPVCRLMDYGKFRYEQSRKERESRKNQHVVELKEVRIRPKIDDHDLETKGRQAAKFLDGGDKVKLTVLFRGREMAHPDIGRGLLDQLSDQLRPHGSIEQTPRMEGRTMTMFMNPLKPKQAPAGAQRAEATSEPESLGRMSTSETPGTAQGPDATSGAERNETNGQAEAENA